MNTSINLNAIHVLCWQKTKQLPKHHSSTEQAARARQPWWVLDRKPPALTGFDVSRLKTLAIDPLPKKTRLQHMVPPCNRGKWRWRKYFRLASPTNHPQPRPTHLGHMRPRRAIRQISCTIVRDAHAAGSCGVRTNCVSSLPMVYSTTTHPAWQPIRTKGIEKGQ